MCIKGRALPWAISLRVFQTVIQRTTMIAICDFHFVQWRCTNGTWLMYESYNAHVRIVHTQCTKLFLPFLTLLDIKNEVCFDAFICTISNNHSCYPTNGVNIPQQLIFHRFGFYIIRNILIYSYFQFYCGCTFSIGK